MPNNSTNNKQIAKNTLFLFFRSIILLFVTLYTSRVVLQALGVTDYGIYNVVGGMVTMFNMIGGTLATASQRFITYALGGGDKNQVKKIFSNSVTLHIVLGLIIVGIIEVAGVWFLYNKLNIPAERITVAGIVLQCSIATFFVNMISIPYNALIIAHEKMSAFAYISIIDGLLRLLSALILLYTAHDKLIVYAFFQLLVSLIVQLVYIIYCKQKFVEAKKISYHIDKPIFKQMFAFAGWNLWGQGSMILRNQGVDIILNLFFGVTVNAAKGVANQVQHGVAQFVSNFQTAVKPQLTKAIAQDNYNRTYKLVTEGTRYSFYLMLLFTVPLIICCEDILKFWLGEVPPYAVIFVQWTMIYMLCDTQSKFLMHAINSTGKIRNYQIIVGGTKLLAMPIVYCILLEGGTPLTGILVNIVLEFVCMAERLYFNRKQLRLPILPFIKESLFLCYNVLMIALIIAYACYYYVSSSVFVNIPFSILASALSIWTIGLHGKERDLALSVIKKKISRFI